MRLEGSELVAICQAKDAKVVDADAILGRAGRDGAGGAGAGRGGGSLLGPKQSKPRRVVEGLGVAQQRAQAQAAGGGGAGGGRYTPKVEAAVGGVLDWLLQVEAEFGDSSGGSGGGCGAPMIGLDELRINDIQVIEGWTRVEHLRARLLSSKCHSCPRLQSSLVRIDRR
jgi:hypothetical protein